MMTVLGLAVAGVSISVSDGYIATDGYCDAIQNGRSAMRKIQSVARQAKLIVASSPTAVVFWAGDTNGDGQINLSEITTITFNGATGEVDEVVVNFAGCPNQQALNVDVPLASLSTVSAALAVQNASTYCQTLPLATSVKSMQVSVSPAAPLATQLSLTFTLGSGEMSLTLYNTAQLRSNATSLVVQNAGVWILQ